MNTDDVTGPVIRLFPEYSRDWPLWSWNMPELDYPISPADVGLSDSLTDRIKTWNDQWQSNFHWEHGWMAGFDIQEWAKEGAAIARLLQEERPDLAVLPEYDWCLSDG